MRWARTRRWVDMVDDEEQDEVQRHNIEDEYMEDWSVLAVAPVQEEDEVQRHNIEDWSALAVAPVQEDGGYNVDQDAADVAAEQEVSDPCLEAVEGAIWYLETITAVVQTDKKFEVMTGNFSPPPTWSPRERLLQATKVEE